jgi:hypothetical protein
MKVVYQIIVLVITISVSTLAQVNESKGINKDVTIEVDTKNRAAFNLRTDFNYPCKEETAELKAMSFLSTQMQLIYNKSDKKNFYNDRNSTSKDNK